MFTEKANAGQQNEAKTEKWKRPKTLKQQKSSDHSS
jgi:hypothetical protein